MKKTPNETFAYYKCSLGEHSQGCRLTFTRQECDCGNAWYRITDNRDQSRLECRKCLPNRKSQTGGYHKDDNKIDFRVFLGLNISLKSIHKDFVIFNTENSFLGKLGPNLTQWLEMGGLAQRKESSFRSLSYPPSKHLSFTFSNHFPFFVVVVVVLVVFFFSRFRLFFFFDKDVCTCSFEPLEHFFTSCCY